MATGWPAQWLIARVKYGLNVLKSGRYKIDSKTPAFSQERTFN